MFDSQLCLHHPNCVYKITFKAFVCVSVCIWACLFKGPSRVYYEIWNIYVCVLILIGSCSDSIIIIYNDLFTVLVCQKCDMGRFTYRRNTMRRWLSKFIPSPLFCRCPDLFYLKEGKLIYLIRHQYVWEWLFPLDQ